MTTFIFFHGDVNYDYQDIKPTSLNSHIIIKKKKKKNSDGSYQFSNFECYKPKANSESDCARSKSFRHYFKNLNSIPYFQHRIPRQSKF